MRWWRTGFVADLVSLSRLSLTPYKAAPLSPSPNTAALRRHVRPEPPPPPPSRLPGARKTGVFSLLGFCKHAADKLRTNPRGDNFPGRPLSRRLVRIRIKGLCVVIAVAILHQILNNLSGNSAARFTTNILHIVLITTLSPEDHHHSSTLN